MRGLALSAMGGVLFVTLSVGLGGPARAQEPAKPEQPTLSIPDAEKVQAIRFDESRDADTADFTIDAKGSSGSTPPVPRASVRGDLISEQGGRIKRNLVSVPKIAPNDVGSGFDVTIRVHPAGRGAGRYTGTVQFGGAGYQSTLPITVEATLREGVGIAALLAFVGWLFGVAIKGVVDLFTAPGENIRSRASVRRWVWRKGFIAVAALGLVGAAAAWALTYYPNHTWGAGDLDEAKLFGAAFAAVVTGTTFADLGAKFK